MKKTQRKPPKKRVTVNKTQRKPLKKGYGK